MEKMGGSRCCLLLLSALALVSSGAARRVEAAETVEPQLKLQSNYYASSCPDVEKYVREQVEFYWKQDKRLAPKLIRILYADCFVVGCDASILLDGPNSEKTAPQNEGFLGFPLEVIDKIKQVLEEHCPGVVSCADIINFAARDAVNLAGAPSYSVLAGRKDGNSSLASTVNLPLAPISWKLALAAFQKLGLDVHDLTTLLGGHSMGKTNCSFIEYRLYNFNNTGKPDPSLDSSYLTQLRKQCPPNSTNQVYLNPDSGSRYSFGKTFYHRVLNHRAILGIDQQIAGQNDSSQIAREYDASFEEFGKQFGVSMGRMGNIKVLTGDQGEVRKNCRVVNSK